MKVYVVVEGWTHYDHPEDDSERVVGVYTTQQKAHAVEWKKRLLNGDEENPDTEYYCLDFERWLDDVNEEVTEDDGRAVVAHEQ